MGSRTRAGAALAGDGTKRVNEKLLAETEAQAKNAPAEAALLLQSLGIHDAQAVTPDADSLDRLERWYRQAAPRAGKDRELLERLLAMVLGQTIIAIHGGQWTIYNGRYHTLSPFVVAVGNTDKVVDVFGFTKDLMQSRANGVQDAQAMSRFARAASKNAF